MANSWIQLRPGHDYYASKEGNYGQKYWHARRWECMIDYAQLSPFDTVLDVGCGCGNLLEKIPTEKNGGWMLLPIK